MHFPDTFRAPFEYPNRTSTTEVFTRCTSSLDLHMLIVSFRYLFGALLVPKVATGITRKAQGGEGSKTNMNT